MFASRLPLHSERPQTEIIRKILITKEDEDLEISYVVHKKQACDYSDYLTGPIDGAPLEGRVDLGTKTLIKPELGAAFSCQG